MIALEELASEANRMKLLVDNTESYEEKFIASNIMQNLLDMLQQYQGLVANPKFPELVEQYKAGLTNDDKS